MALPKLTQAQRDECCRLLENGQIEDVDWAARKFGVKRRTVYDWVVDWKKKNETNNAPVR